MIVRTGLDVLASNLSCLHGKQIAVLCHAASVTANCEHIIDLLSRDSKILFKKIFAPEHGLFGTAQDMVEVVGEGVAGSGIPIISLYGNTVESLYPKREDLIGLDLLLVDLPDIGTRFYTYAQTMAFCMKVAGEVGVKVAILDRPNPINGVDVEGGSISPSCRSFCGMTPVAVRHGLTLGELAIVYNRGFGKDSDAFAPIRCEFEVIRAEGWTRSIYFDNTRLPWVLPSPNMPTLDTAIVYPGACLFEATNLSEGRGTTKPFEILGAPFVDGERWARAVTHQGLTLHGAALRPLKFLPQFQKWKGEVCGGVQIHITDRNAFKPLRWALALIAAAKQLYPQQFQWRTGAYEFVDSVPAIDLLYGSDRLRIALETGVSLKCLDEELIEYEKHYREAVADFQIYR